jgi:effector-binding domain-containing protein
MAYEVQIVQTTGQLTGVIRAQAKQADLPKVVPQLCGEVWSFFKAAHLPKPGRHVALYLDGVMNIEVGVEVAQPFAGNGRVVCSALPAGTAITTAHWGPYDKLSGAYDAIKDWAAKNGHVLDCKAWEVYGHWTDDPAQLRTDVYWLVKA